MKNFAKFLGIIAAVAVIGLSFAACGEKEDGGGKATVIFKNTTSETVNAVAVVEAMGSSLMEDNSANIAPGAEKSYKVNPLKNTDYYFFMDGVRSTFYELAGGKTYTVSYTSNAYNLTVTVK